MLTYDTADAEHNTYVLALVEAIGAHTVSMRQAAECGEDPGAVRTRIVGLSGDWLLSYGEVLPRHCVSLQDGHGAVLRFEAALDPVAARMRAIDDSRPCGFQLTTAGEQAVCRA